MQELIDFYRIKARVDRLLLLIFLSSIGFTLIAYFSMQILLKINESKTQFGLQGGDFFIVFLLIIPFTTGSFFSIIIDRSLIKEKFQKSIYTTHCIICKLPLKNNVIECNYCHSKFHSWHQIQYERQENFKCTICDKKTSFSKFNDKNESRKLNKIIILDGTNLACDIKPPTIKNIRLAQESLISKGFETICIVSPSLKYRIFEQDEFKKEIKENNFIQSPAGSYDDRFIIETAKKFNGYILSNDRFSDLNEYKEDVKNRRMTFTFIKNEIIIDFSPSISKKYKTNISE